MKHNPTFGFWEKWWDDKPSVWEWFLIKLGLKLPDIPNILYVRNIDEDTVEIVWESGRTDRMTVFTDEEIESIENAKLDIKKSKKY